MAIAVYNGGVLYVRHTVGAASSVALFMQTDKLEALAKTRLCQRIDDLILEKNLSYCEAAKLLGLEFQELLDTLRGETEVSVRELERFVRVLESKA